MDVGKSTNVISNLFNSGAIKDTVKDRLKESEGQDKSNIEKSNSLLSGIDHKTEEGRKALQARASKIDAKSLMQEYALQFQMGVMDVAQSSFAGQGGASGGGFRDILNQINTNLIGYNGKPLGTLTPEEAKDLLGEGGFFSQKETADRIANFVIAGAGDDLNKLQKGREGVLEGYKQAEKLWGGKLPEISKKTLEDALKKIDERIEALQNTSKSSFEAQA